MVVRAPGAPVDSADRPLVLVDVRPSACGYRALLWALGEAERRDAELLAVSRWPGDPAEPDDGRAEMERAFEDTVRRAIEETGVHGRTRLRVLTGPVTPAEVAGCAGADLLVLGAEEVS